MKAQDQQNKKKNLYFSPVYPETEYNYLQKLGFDLPSPEPLNTLVEPIRQHSPCIIFTDPGIDDYLALATLRNFFDNLTLVACGGNTRSKQIIDNCRVVRDTLGLETQIMKGLPGPLPLKHKQDNDHDNNAEEVHGQAGLGPFDHKTLSSHITGSNASEWQPQSLLNTIETQAKMVDTQQQETIIFSLAPTQELCELLTLIAETNPALGQHLRIVMMGLAVDPQQANSKNTAGLIGEFNAIFDYTATQKVFRLCEQLKIDVQLVPADITHQRQALWHQHHQQALGALANKSQVIGLKMLTEIFSNISEKNIKGFQWADDQSGYPPNPVHDAVAIISLLDPSQFTGTRLGLVLEDDGTLSQNGAQNVIAVDTLPSAGPNNIADRIVTQLRENYGKMAGHSLNQYNGDTEPASAT